ncbi:hypothetical protein GE09DRAFT_1280358 [Coniochaeta sp. 2T2.1]|nr:hypothetical protein GE09DRAFT_1280358 [Coniochaeta sp. 2T2.1]
MQSKIFNAIGLLAALTTSAAATDRTTCPTANCIEHGGSAYCLDEGCDGGCSLEGKCGGPPECNIHFSNCRRTIEHDTARRAGFIVEYPNGTVESLPGVEEYVAAVLESMRR